MQLSWSEDADSEITQCPRHCTKTVHIWHCSYSKCVCSRVYFYFVGPHTAGHRRNRSPWGRYGVSLGSTGALPTGWQTELTYIITVSDC